MNECVKMNDSIEMPFISMLPIAAFLTVQANFNYPMNIETTFNLIDVVTFSHFISLVSSHLHKR